MFIPIIRKYQAGSAPEQVYRNLYVQNKVSFFLDSIKHHEPDQNYSYLGMNPFLEAVLSVSELKLKGAENKVYPSQKAFSVLKRLFKKYKTPSKYRKEFFMGGAVGFLSYELSEQFEKIKVRKKKASKLPLFYFGFYRDLIVFDHKAKSYLLVTHNKTGVKSKATEKRLDVLEAIISKSEVSSPKLKQKVSAFKFQMTDFKPEMNRQEFSKRVLKAKEYIAAGDIYQANLSQKFNFNFEGSALKLYEDLREINPSPFSSFLKIGDLQVVSSSPERLVRKKKNICDTRPIAGTHPLKDKHLKASEIQKKFLSNEKERAEHIMLVDLERNDLGRVCDYKTVKVEEMMAIERYSHVMHIVSKITGRLAKGRDAFDVIRAMFPGGTITGCPKIRCMEIIDELEPSKRGLYTGSIGYLDFFGDMDLNIVIRTLVLQKKKGYLQVGAGIVHDSDPSKEYEETLHKGEALTEALVKASVGAPS